MESTERIHPPTPHRRQTARQQGHVAKSQDLPLAGVFLGGVLLLMLGGSELFGAMADYVRQQLGDLPTLTSNAALPLEAGGAAVLRLGRSLALVCGGLLAVLVAHLLPHLVRRHLQRPLVAPPEEAIISDRGNQQRTADLQTDSAQDLRDSVGHRRRSEIA